MSSLYPETNWAQGASGGNDIYDTSPAGLGLSPAYLGGASASASSSTTTSGTVFPSTPADGNVFIYTADAVNRIRWAFIYNAAGTTYKWEFIGGPPMYAAVVTNEQTTNAAYTSLTTTGPQITLPFAGDWDVSTHCQITAPLSAGIGFQGFMSYDIGGTAAVDADAIYVTNAVNSATQSTLHDVYRLKRQTGLSAITLTAKFKSSSGTASNFQNRVMSITPVRVTG